MKKMIRKEQNSLPSTTSLNIIVEEISRRKMGFGQCDSTCNCFIDSNDFSRKSVVKGFESHAWQGIFVYCIVSRGINLPWCLFYL